MENNKKNRFDISTYRVVIIINDDQQYPTIPNSFISNLLYMFWAIPSPIIRSTLLYLQLRVLSTNIAGIMDEMELTFHFIHDTNQQQYWLTIPEAVSTVICS
jgi:hypothetical protein